MRRAESRAAFFFSFQVTNNAKLCWLKGQDLSGRQVSLGISSFRNHLSILPFPNLEKNFLVCVVFQKTKTTTNNKTQPKHFFFIIAFKITRKQSSEINDYPLLFNTNFFFLSNTVSPSQFQDFHLKVLFSLRCIKCRLLPSRKHTDNISKQENTWT